MTKDHDLLARIDTDLTFCPANDLGDPAYDGWCWTVYLNGIQYASEVLPEKSLHKARKNIAKWTRKAMKETNPFYFTKKAGEG